LEALQVAEFGFEISDLFFKFAISNPKSEIDKGGNSSVGRALASQAKGREFESRFPLKIIRKYRLPFLL
jgi:hypothetical protein